MNSMKMIDRTETGVPSFETEWRNNAETQEQPAPNKTQSASTNAAGPDFVWPSAYEASWRGFTGYDSPLAG